MVWTKEEEGLEDGPVFGGISSQTSDLHLLQAAFCVEPLGNFNIPIRYRWLFVNRSNHIRM